MSAPEYEIATVADFAKVPDDRLPQCLYEFASFVLDFRAKVKMEELRLETFTWIDDGIPLVREAHLKIRDRTEVIPNPNFPAE